MADVDPIVEPLLSGLLLSPLAAYGRAAGERLDEDEAAEGDRDDERVLIGPDGPLPRLRRLRRAQRQLKFIDAVIQGELRRELAMTERLQGLAERLGVSTIEVLPPTPPGPEREPGPLDPLLDRARAAAIRAFLDTWDEAVSQTRGRLEEEV